MQDDGFGDLRARRVDGVQARHGLLEDHRDLIAADASHLGLLRLPEVFAAELDGSRFDAARRRGDEAQDGERHDALAAATLADDAHAGAVRDVERDSIDRAEHPRVRTEARDHVSNAEEGRRHAFFL
jgi:hypothetical protein